MAKGFICNVCALFDQLLQSKLRSIPEWIQGTNSFKWIEVTMKGILRCKYGDMNGTMLLQAIAGLGREDSCLCTEEHSKATCFCSWARAVWHLKLIEFFWRKTKRSTRHHYITHLSCRRIKRCHNVCIITQGTKQAESAQVLFYDCKRSSIHTLCFPLASDINSHRGVVLRSVSLLKPWCLNDDKSLMVT